MKKVQIALCIILFAPLFTMTYACAEDTHIIWLDGVLCSINDENQYKPKCRYIVKYDYSCYSFSYYQIPFGAIVIGNSISNNSIIFYNERSVIRFDKYYFEDEFYSQEVLEMNPSTIVDIYIPSDVNIKNTTYSCYGDFLCGSYSISIEDYIGLLWVKMSTMNGILNDYDIQYCYMELCHNNPLNTGNLILVKGDDLKETMASIVDIDHLASLNYSFSSCADLAYYDNQKRTIELVFADGINYTIKDINNEPTLCWLDDMLVYALPEYDPMQDDVLSVSLMCYDRSCDQIIPLQDQQGNTIHIYPPFGNMKYLENGNLVYLTRRDDGWIYSWYLESINLYSGESNEIDLYAAFNRDLGNWEIDGMLSVF